MKLTQTELMMFYKRFLVLSGKGGCGKTTVTDQIIIPFIQYITNNNDDIKVAIFDNSNTAERNMEGINYKFVSKHKLSSEMINFKCEEYNIFEAGSGDVPDLLKELRSQGIDHKKELFIIPIGTGIEDVANAKTCFEYIKEINSLTKIIFVLNKLPSLDEDRVKMAFPNVFGSDLFDVGTTLLEVVGENNFNYIALPNSELIINSQYYSNSVYQLGKTKTDYDSLIAQAKTKEEKKQLMSKRGLRNKCQLFTDEVLSADGGAFEKIMDILSEMDSLK